MRDRPESTDSLSHSAPPNAAPDLDFSTAAAPAPTPERIERAVQEAEEGKAELANAGYLVSITRQAPEPILPRNGMKYVVLVVEDDADLGQLLIDIFMLAGYEVRWASNRAEINTELRRGDEVDVILLDVLLPDADGIQILQRLRGHPKFARIPVIMITGKSGAQDVGAGLAAGADGYVTKPFKMSGLVKAVSLVLGNA
jgi:two-component system OmpR family response regulator